MKRDIKITLNGKEYRARMTVGAMIDIEDEIGIPLTQIRDDTISVKLASTIFKNVIRKEDGKREFTDDEWSELMFYVEPAELFDALGTVMNQINKKSEEEEAKNE